MQEVTDDTRQPGRRDAIMAAAVSVLAERGPRGLTHRAVDAAAGLNAGAVNHHAPTRAKLWTLTLEEVFRRDIETAASHFRTSVSNRDDAVEAITDFVLEMSSAAHRSHVIARHHLRSESMCNPDLRHAFDEQDDAMLQTICDIFAISNVFVTDTRAELIRVSIEGLIQRQTMIGAAALSHGELAEIASLILPRPAQSGEGPSWRYAPNA